MKKKSLKPWIICLVLPMPLLILNVILQAAVRFNTGDDNVIKAIVNINSILLGTIAVVMMLLIPLWIILLVRTSSYNEKLETSTDDVPQSPYSQNNLAGPETVQSDQNQYPHSNNNKNTQ